MSGWMTDVFICYFIVALLLLLHNDLSDSSLALEDISLYQFLVARSDIR